MLDTRCCSRQSPQLQGRKLWIPNWSWQGRYHWASRQHHLHLIRCVKLCQTLPRPLIVLFLVAAAAEHELCLPSALCYADVVSSHAAARFKILIKLGTIFGTEFWFWVKYKRNLRILNCVSNCSRISRFSRIFEAPTHRFNIITVMTT